MDRDDTSIIIDALPEIARIAGRRELDDLSDNERCRLKSLYSVVSAAVEQGDWQTPSKIRPWSGSKTGELPYWLDVILENSSGSLVHLTTKVKTDGKILKASGSPVVLWRFHNPFRYVN